MTKPTNVLRSPAATLCAIACLCWFAVACGGDEPEVSDAPNYEATVAAALEKVGESEPTATAEPTPTPKPTEIPPSLTPTMASAGAPPPPVAGDMEPLAPLPINDPNALLADLSEGERSCLSGTVGPERLAALLGNPESADEADRSALLGCLEHATRLRLLLTPVLSATGPLSLESSQCVRNSYADTDLQALMSL